MGDRHKNARVYEKALLGKQHQVSIRGEQGNPAVSNSILMGKTAASGFSKLDKSESRTTKTTKPPLSKSKVN